MYKINYIARLAGISTRTLRYYDKIGLLTPSYIANNNYRYYTDKEIDILQQILFYKELEFTLEDIKSIVTDMDFNFIGALYRHKTHLLAKQRHLENLIETINRTIQNDKGEIVMTNDEKFAGLKEKQINENEDKYGEELRKLYDVENIEGSYKKIRKMSKWEFNDAKRLEKEIREKLSYAIKEGSYSCNLAMEVCELHEKWIKMYWTSYTKQTHLKLIEMYTIDERFKAYYEKVGKGATTFLYQAMQLYVKKDH